MKYSTLKKSSKMRTLLVFFFLFSGTLSSFTQPFYLQARINGFDGSRVYLVQFKGDQQSIIDSAASLGGVFTFHFSGERKPGVYRVLLGEKGSSNFFDEDPQFFDFIYNRGSVILQTSYDALADSMNILTSDENATYYTFLKGNEIYQSKLNRIVALFEVYKAGDPFFDKLRMEFLKLQEEFALFSLEQAGKLPGSIVASIIQTSMLPVIEEPGSPGTMTIFIREHYFDLISFSDPRLLNSPFITKTIFDYLGLYRNSALDQMAQEDEFIKAIGPIMEASSSDPEIYDFVLNFLVDGFQRFQMEKVLVHIAENYIEGGCETDSQKLLQKRLEGYEKMAPGKKAPDILIFNQEGIQVRLYDLDNQYTLVLFWASWCPHCNSFLKQLGKWYPDRTIDLEVFAVSIDTSRFAWEEQSMMDNYPWINTISGAGWDGKAPKDYNVYATPTLFLLDHERKIIAKPLTFREFKKEVEKLQGNP